MSNMTTFNTAELNPVSPVETTGVVPVPTSEVPTTSVEDLVPEGVVEGNMKAEISVPAVSQAPESVSVLPETPSAVKFSVGYEPDMGDENSPSAITAYKAQGLPPQD